MYQSKKKYTHIYLSKFVFGYRSVVIVFITFQCYNIDISVVELKYNDLGKSWTFATTSARKIMVTAVIGGVGMLLSSPT